MCQMVLDICPKCKLHCIFLGTQKKKNEDRKKKDDDKKKDKDKKAQAKVDKAARMKNFRSSNKAEGDAIKNFNGC
ncbi:hypothetical protein J4E91_008808 [Alternaria rosae]|nr:hypothetical protein J4E91_008808 [Alternaria rosae]